MRRGKSLAYVNASRNSVYTAVLDSFNIPDNDRVILVSQHDAEEFDYDPGFLNIVRSDALVIIQVTCNNTRTLPQKQAFYKAVAEKLGADPGGPEDVIINLVETTKENWSFGHGMAFV